MNSINEEVVLILKKYSIVLDQPSLRGKNGVKRNPAPSSHIGWAIGAIGLVGGEKNPQRSEHLGDLGRPTLCHPRHRVIRKAAIMLIMGSCH